MIKKNKRTGAQKVQRAVLGAAFFTLTVLNFLAELFTLRIFRRSEPTPELGTHAQSRAQAGRSRGSNPQTASAAAPSAPEDGGDARRSSC